MKFDPLHIKYVSVNMPIDALRMNSENATGSYLAIVISTLI